MRSVDFEAIRAETQPGEPVEVTAGKDKFLVRPELPWLFIEYWDVGNVDLALRQLLVDPDRRTGKDRPTALQRFHDLVFADGVSRATALDRIIAIWKVPGESSASSRSSANGSPRSRPTSKRTTR